jgi:hypothetical protein
MLSYKHAFHAGNHADLIKHIVLTFALDLYTVKDKPFIYIDSHAGSGIYNLSEKESNTTGEYKLGIKRLQEFNGIKKLCGSYFSVIDKINANGGFSMYPGSPYIAQTLLRENDQMIFMELHNTEFEKLVYRQLIFNHKISGRDCCLLLYDQGFLKYNNNDYYRLLNGNVTPYNFVIEKIRDLEITPGMLALEPCSGSIVITDVNTGDIRALVKTLNIDNGVKDDPIDNSVNEGINNELEQELG